eukprot:14556951-Alexandrium_andersonii.AAC.1
MCNAGREPCDVCPGQQSPAPAGIALRCRGPRSGPPPFPARGPVGHTLSPCVGSLTLTGVWPGAAQAKGHHLAGVALRTVRVSPREAAVIVMPAS